MPKRIKIERYKGSGPGGQNRNKRETAIRLTDLETGIQVTATERRTQGENLRVALERFERRLEQARRKPKKRIRTKPGRKARENRITTKKHLSKKKSNRNSRLRSDD